MILSLALTAFAGGCNLMAIPAVLLSPRHETKTILPEYEGLKGKSVAVVVYAGPELQVDYQTLQLEVGEAVASQLSRNVEGIKVSDERQVLRYQEENPDWDSRHRYELAKSLAVDYVLLVSLIDFSTHEPGTAYLARGIILAQVSVFPVTPPADGMEKAVWRSDHLGVTWPTDRPLTSENAEWQVRVEAQRAFADAVAKKFYKHTVTL
jgi:hypothetical protein